MNLIEPTDQLTSYRPVQSLPFHDSLLKEARELAGRRLLAGQSTFFHSHKNKALYDEGLIFVALLIIHLMLAPIGLEFRMTMLEKRVWNKRLVKPSGT